MKVQLKYILPHGVLTSPDFIFSQEFTVVVIKEKISDIFNIPFELVLLKIERNHIFVSRKLFPYFKFYKIRITNEFPISFYDINENDVIYVQDTSELQNTISNPEFQKHLSKKEMNYEADVHQNLKILLEVFIIII